MNGELLSVNNPGATIVVQGGPGLEVMSLEVDGRRKSILNVPASPIMLEILGNPNGLSLPEFPHNQDYRLQRPHVTGGL